MFKIYSHSLNTEIQRRSAKYYDLFESQAPGEF
jgi:hypothetical protein